MRAHPDHGQPASRPRRLPATLLLLAALVLLVASPRVGPVASAAAAAAQEGTTQVTEGPCGTVPCQEPTEGPCGTVPCTSPPAAVGPCGTVPCTTPPADQGPCGANPCPTPAPTDGPCGPNPCESAVPPITATSVTVSKSGAGLCRGDSCERFADIRETPDGPANDTARPATLAARRSSNGPKIAAGIATAVIALILLVWGITRWRRAPREEY